MIERLTTDELKAITNRTRYSSQMKVLRAMGITCEPDGDGRPVVLRSHAEAILGGGSLKKATQEHVPNWGALG